MVEPGTWDISGIPGMLDDMMFGGTNIMAAQVLICAFVLFVLTMPMIMKKIPLEGMLVVYVITVLALTGIGWLDPVILMVLLFIIAAMLAKPVSSFVRGGT